MADASVQSFGMLEHWKMAAASGQVGIEGVAGWMGRWGAVLMDSLSAWLDWLPAAAGCICQAHRQPHMELLAVLAGMMSARYTASRDVGGGLKMLWRL